MSNTCLSSLFSRNLLDKDTFSKSDPSKYVGDTLVFVFLLTLLQYCCYQAQVLPFMFVLYVLFLFQFCGQYCLFVHCTGAKTLSMICRWISLRLFDSVSVFFSLSGSRFFFFFHLLISLSGTFFTVCVLYTQGVETKQWREVSMHTENTKNTQNTRPSIHMNKKKKRGLLS